MVRDFLCLRSNIDCNVILSSRRKGWVREEEVFRLREEVDYLKSQMDSVTNTIHFDLGVETQRENPCERMFNLATKVNNLRRATLKASNELFNYVESNDLESMYVIYILQDKDAARQVFLKQDFHYWKSIATKLDEQRNTSYTQTQAMPDLQYDRISSAKEILAEGDTFLPFSSEEKVENITCPCPSSC